MYEWVHTYVGTNLSQGHHYQSMLTAIANVDGANAASTEKDDDHNEDKNTVTPRRRELQKRAHDKMSKAALSMKRRVLETVGDDKVCEVGEVVHVLLKDMDKAKVDSGNLTGVIILVDKTHSQARVAVKSGTLKGWYVYHRLPRPYK